MLCIHYSMLVLTLLLPLESRGFFLLGGRLSISPVRIKKKGGLKFSKMHAESIYNEYNCRYVVGFFILRFEREAVSEKIVRAICAFRRTTPGRLLLIIPTSSSTFKQCFTSLNNIFLTLNVIVRINSYCFICI